MKLWLLLGSLIVILMVHFTSGVNDCRHDSCNDCIQSPKCLWCMKEAEVNVTENFPRCISGKSEDVSAWREYCETKNIVDLEYSFEKVEDKPFQGNEGEDIIQMKPQKVKLSLRVKEPFNMTLKYRHAKNFPVDLYYLMDASTSMADDKEMLSKLGGALSDSIKQITSNFRLGFGAFVDKPILPYVSSVPLECEDCSAYGFFNALPLTHDASIFETKVKEAKTASNQDFPEGGFDALMQAMVCTTQIDWRDQSIRLLVLSTDAGFHYAGDGKLGGVLTPNDMLCHLDNGYYTHSAMLDYPSVSQINYVAKNQSISLVFAVTEKVEPLYARLSRQIDGASSGILEKDSSNIVDLLTDKVKDIISTMKLRDASGPLVKIKYFSACKDGQMKERSSCKNLEPFDEVEFEIEFTVEECPGLETMQHQQIKIYQTGRPEVLEVDLKMECDCNCDEEGDLGYIAQAEQCSWHGDFECGLCNCNDGYLGNKCECSTSDGTDVISDKSCKATNTSKVCSGMGSCICGVCQCNQRTSLVEKITGKFCGCTNYLNCQSPNGLCNGNGDCDCSRCVCKDGWKGALCDCEESEESCKNPDNGDICSGQGLCDCNQCKCNQDYFGKWCEDCPECTGKCEEYQPCVQCKSFNIKEYSQEFCQTNCTLINVTKVSTVDVTDTSERLCEFTDDDDCRYYFVYSQKGDGYVVVRVQEEVECPTVVNVWAVVIGVLVTVVLIGLLTLIIWRVLATIHDRREYQKFILEQNEAKWSTSDNPLYKKATTDFQNPIFGRSN